MMTMIPFYEKSSKGFFSYINFLGENSDLTTDVNAVVFT